MKLQIDFVTQQGNTTRNDCGPACLSMLTGATIMQVLTAISHPPDRMMHMTAVIQALVAYRIPHEHRRPLSLADLRGWLANGWPVLLLVRYGRLPHQARATAYEGNHYVLATGYDPAGFFVHDPLWPDAARGAWRHWESDDLALALRDVEAAQPFQGIVVKQARAILEPSVADVGPMVATTVADLRAELLRWQSAAETETMLRVREELRTDELAGMLGTVSSDLAAVYALLGIQPGAGAQAAALGEIRRLMGSRRAA